MPSEQIPPETEQITHVMRGMMVQTALHHRGEEPFQSIDPFSATLLEECGMLSFSEPGTHSEELLQCVINPDHPKRIPSPPGPLLFLRGDNKNVSVMAPADMLADSQPDVRLAAMSYFLGLPDGAIAPRTRRLMEEARTQIASGTRAQWLPAAKGVFDLLRNDMYLTLAGFHQSFALNYEAGVQEYLPRILRPDASLLASVEAPFWSPTEEYKGLSAAVRGLVESASLPEALSNYYRAHGHLPLTGSLGLGEVLRIWAETRSATEIWPALWAWADEQPSPVPRYHACVALLANPTFVPQGSEGTLWAEVAEVIGAALASSRHTRWEEAWLLREDLACHFGNYLECLTPLLPSERVMGMAWWLTERFCELLPPSAGLHRKVRETTVAGELERSGLMNHATHPPVGPSGLRYLTRVSNRLWSTSILCELGSARWLLERGRPPEEQRLRIEDGVLSVLAEGYPPPAGVGENPVYGFDRPSAQLAENWTELASETEGSKRTAMENLLRQRKLLATDESLPEMLGLLAEENQNGAPTFGHALRLKAYTDPTIGPKLWEILNEERRWEAILGHSKDDVVTLVFEALTELCVRDGDPWRPAVPHMFAYAGEKASTRERRDLLYGLTLFASLHAGTVSALDRLMHGHFRAEFVEYASRWRDQLRAVLRFFTPWAAARVRSILPSLTLDIQ